MELKSDGKREGVVFTSEDYEAVRQWVQDRAVQAEIVATPKRLYLPMGANHMDAVNPGDTIWFAPDSKVLNAFNLTRG